MALSLSSCGWVDDLLHSRRQVKLKVKGISCSSSSRVRRSKKGVRVGAGAVESVEKLVESAGVSSIARAPLVSLQRGNWVKLICGASFEDVVDIRNLSLVYTLAGVDCIDCAADASVVAAVNQGIQAAMNIVSDSIRRPWVMISVNDHQDLHFRKAAFDPLDCPLDCSRPCEAVCPANAIALKKGDSLEGGVISERCYGCGRCLPVCPYDKITAVTYLRDAVTTAQLVRRNDVDAIEIHTNGSRQTTSFEEFWNGMGDSVSQLKLVAISLPDVGQLATTLMSTMFTIMRPNLSCYNLWQLDGRPMSGDIGRGATRESLAFAARLAVAEDRPPGFLQLAGGTNAHTVNGLKALGLYQTQRKSKVGMFSKEMSGSCNSLIGGIAYGGYARKIVGRILRSMQLQHGLACIENYPAYLSEALCEALDLVGSVKCYLNVGVDQQ